MRSGLWGTEVKLFSGVEDEKHCRGAAYRNANR
jgi:hypothetical protein